MAATLRRPRGVRDAAREDWIGVQQTDRSWLRGRFLLPPLAGFAFEGSGCGACPGAPVVQGSVGNRMARSRQAADGETGALVVFDSLSKEPPTDECCGGFNRKFFALSVSLWLCASIR